MDLSPGAAPTAQVDHGQQGGVAEAAATSDVLACLIDTPCYSLWCPRPAAVLSLKLGEDLIHAADRLDNPSAKMRRAVRRRHGGALIPGRVAQGAAGRHARDSFESL